MATGEITGSTSAPDELEYGEALMPGGRISVARRTGPEHPLLPFTTGQLSRLDEALTLSTRSTDLEFAIYLGDLGEDTRAQAEALHANLGQRAGGGVLIAVSPAQRQIEIVTGEEAYRRVSDRSCQLAVMSMVASFKENEFTDGLISALRMLSDSGGAKQPT